MTDTNKDKVDLLVSKTKTLELLARLNDPETKPYPDDVIKRARSLASSIGFQTEDGWVEQWNADVFVWDVARKVEDYLLKTYITKSDETLSTIGRRMDGLIKALWTEPEYGTKWYA